MPAPRQLSFSLRHLAAALLLLVLFSGTAYAVVHHHGDSDHEDCVTCALSKPEVDSSGEAIAESPAPIRANDAPVAERVHRSVQARHRLDRGPPTV